MASIPPGALGDGVTRVLLAVVAGDRFIPDICKRLGRNRSTVWFQLEKLQGMGLISSAYANHHRQPGTIRPRVRLVA